MFIKCVFYSLNSLVLTGHQPLLVDEYSYIAPCRARNKAYESCQGFRKHPKTLNNPILGSKKYFKVGLNISFYLSKFTTSEYNFKIQLCRKIKLNIHLIF